MTWRRVELSLECAGTLNRLYRSLILCRIVRCIPTRLPITLVQVVWNLGDTVILVQFLLVVLT